jgi:hypothetical protein
MTHPSLTRCWKRGVKKMSTKPTVQAHTNWERGDWAPDWLLTAEREKEPVVV